ncbi:MAG TPA: efflux RND transporter permease subunit [Dongiaceae bacterium]|nr:efflux RND transporter permease subunit [Dongiaceae bacterium]
MNISTRFIERPIATSLIMLGVLLAGAVAVPLLPVAPLPQIDFPTISVSASLPGASPETMASTVATPLEQQFSEIPGVSQMTSSSQLGSTQITVQFDLDRNIDAAAQDIQSAIDAAAGQLPKNLPSPPSYRKVNPADPPMLAYIIHSDVQPLTAVDDYAENVVAQQISQLPGISQVVIGGQAKPAVRVQVNPAKLAALGLSLDDVANVISTVSVDAAKGSVDGPSRNFTIYDNDQLTTAAPWNDVVIAYRKGAPIRIRDIGTAIDGPENAKVAAWGAAAGGAAKRGVLLIVYKQPGANVIDAVSRIEARLPQILLSVPPSVKVDKVVDRTTTIKASVRDVNLTLLLTVALVVMVIFLFLRNFWATVIPGVTVPLALVATAGLMFVVGYSLDNLSLMAFTIAVGFVVDDAIVMLENIYRHLEEGLSAREAAIKGAGEIGFTIVSISVSLVAVFIPLLLMGGIVGRLFREFAVTVTMTIAVSALVSLTLTPTMCSIFLKDEKHRRHNRLYQTVERFFDRMLALYANGLDFVLARRRATLGVFVLTVIATGWLYVLVPKGFFPQQDTGTITGFSEAAEDVSYAEMARLQQQVLDVISKDPDVAGWGSAIGGNRPFNTGLVVITLKPRDQRTASADQVIARLRPQLARVKGIALFMQAAQDLNVGGRLSRTQYQYTLEDSDIDELNAWAPKILARLKTLPQLRDVASDQETGGGTLSLSIDRDQAARFGIQPALIDQTLNDAFGQRQVTQYFTQRSSYHVIIEVDPKLQGDPQTLDRIYLTSPITGQQVPLSTFAKYDTRKTSFLSISHQGQFPAVTLSFNLAPGAALGDAVNAVQQAVSSIGAPAALLGTFQGNAQAFQDSLKSEPYLILAAILTVYIILGVLYESYIHPLTILSTLPSAGMGALLMLMLFHFDLSIIALVGILLLIGIVKKNGIMMVDFAIAAERNEGLSPEQSIRQACLLRFRPIMMTTMATLLGAVPLALGHGTGSELRQPLGVTMIGGLVVSQALTLFTTPVVYLYLDRVNQWLGRHRPAAAKARAIAPGE